MTERLLSVNTSNCFKLIMTPTREKNRVAFVAEMEQ